MNCVIKPPLNPQANDNNLILSIAEYNIPNESSQVNMIHRTNVGSMLVHRR